MGGVVAAGGGPAGFAPSAFARARSSGPGAPPQVRYSSKMAVTAPIATSRSKTDGMSGGPTRPCARQNTSKMLPSLVIRADRNSNQRWLKDSRAKILSA